MTEPIRLNKYLAHATGVSRREADELIAQGRVMVNGRTAGLGQQISETDLLNVNGRTVENRAIDYTYLLLNKPVGYLCSRRSQGGSPTIYELLPEKYRSLKPVGRLDRDSSGLLFLTDDGNFAHRMTHPSFHKHKMYEVALDHSLEPLHQQMISDYGVTLEDGMSKFMVEKIDNHPTAEQKERSARASEKEAPLRNSPPSQAREQTSLYRVIMHEGRNRQIRRTFAALGYRVTALHRVSFGVCELGGLPSGKFRKLALPSMTKPPDRG